MSHVILEGLTRSFREGNSTRQVLRGLDLAIDPGEFVALLGRSGAGKSTLLNVISGIDIPDSGRVVVGGTDLTALDDERRTLFRREHVGFVFQSFNLVPTLTVAENVLLPVTLAGDRSAGRRDEALAVLDEVGLSDRHDAFPDVLSGGEQQRVAIARALAHKPLLLLADEPTGNLDYDTGRQVMGLLHGLVTKLGTTMLVVTHDRDFLDASDRVVEMRDGVLREVSAEYFRS